MLNIQGTLNYQAGAGINQGTTILVPKGTSLRLGKACYIGRYVEISSENSIQIGNYSTIQDRCTLLGDILIGQYCLFGKNVYASSGRHNYDYLPQYLIRDQDKMAANSKSINWSHPIEIGDDCWIGANVVVIAGISIGKGAIVAANSVVCQNVLPYTVVAGIPAKMTNYRLDFKPPISISFKDQKSWPYFYFGFQLSVDEQHQNECLRCIVAYDRFAICLSKHNALNVCLRVVLLNSKSCTLTYEGQTASITECNQIVQFKASDQSQLTTQFIFEVKGEGNMTFGIQEAWLQ